MCRKIFCYSLIKTPKNIIVAYCVLEENVNYKKRYVFILVFRPLAFETVT